MLFQSLIVYFVFMTILYLYARSIAISSARLNSDGVVEQRFLTRGTAFLILFFSIVSGLRYDVGVDHLGYLYNLIAGNYYRYEIAFKYVTRLFYYNDWSPVLYFSLWAGLQILFFLLAFKKEKYLWPYFMIFIFLCGQYSSWMNGIRQDIAGAIWIFSLVFVIKRKPSLYLLWVFIAFMFHRSAIALVIFYPILNSSQLSMKNTKLQVAIFLFAILFGYMSEPFWMRLSPVVEYYSNLISNESMDYSAYYSMESMLAQNKGREAGLGVLLYDIVYLTIIIYGNKIKDFYKTKKCNICYFFFYIFVIIKAIIPVGALSLARPFRYFSPFVLVMIGYLLYYLKTKGEEVQFAKSTYVSFFLLFFILFIYGQYSSNEYSHSLFQFYFQHDDVFGLPLR